MFPSLKNPGSHSPLGEAALKTLGVYLYGSLFFTDWLVGCLYM